MYDRLANVTSRSSQVGPRVTPYECLLTSDQQTYKNYLHVIYAAINGPDLYTVHGLVSLNRPDTSAVGAVVLKCLVPLI